MLRLIVPVLRFYLILEAHCRSLHGQIAQRLSKQKYPNAEIRRHSFCLCRSLCDRRSLLRERSFACEARYKCRSVCSRLNPSRTFTSFDCETHTAFAGFGPVRSKHCCYPYGILICFTHSRLNVVARAASNVAGVMASHLVTSIMHHLARMCICLFIP